VHSDGERGGDFAVGKELDAFVTLLNQTGLDQLLGSDFGCAGYTLQIAKIDDFEDSPENIGESSLGNTTLQGHLTAFKPGRGPAAGACFLTLRASSGCFAKAGT
jgi:hypothetical protein